MQSLIDWVLPIIPIALLMGAALSIQYAVRLVNQTISDPSKHVPNFKIDAKGGERSLPSETFLYFLLFKYRTSHDNHVLIFGSLASFLLWVGLATALVMFGYFWDRPTNEIILFQERR